jgi:hypothetical protein
MRKLMVWLTASVIFAAANGPRPTAAQSAFGDPNAEPAPFNPQMSALMSMLIQPRHAKLGLAGQAENWPLAGYALKELRQGFLVVSRAVPRWKGLPVPDLVDASVDQPLKLIEAAIKLQYKGQFDEAYARLTERCNACHATTEHSYIVIKVPDASAFPNQDFGTKR